MFYMWAQFLITILLIIAIYFIGKKMIYNSIMKKGLEELNEMTEDEELLSQKKFELEKTLTALHLRMEEVDVAEDLIEAEKQLKEVNNKLLDAEKARNQ